MSNAPHFRPELFRFLRQLKRNNTREWFEKNKPRYVEHVRDPLLRFIEDFEPYLRRISRSFVADARANGGSMFRIYRDTRFSRDKTPYKTTASAHFRHARAKDVHCPGFYLHLAPDEVFVGAGIWRPDGSSLRAIRERLLEDGAAWKRLRKTKALREDLRLEGDSLKRAPRGIDPEHPLIEDLKRKDFIVVAEFDEAAACAPEFLKDVAATCRKAGPFVQFLTEAVGVEWSPAVAHARS